MSNIDTRWEQALLNKVTSKGERIAVIERDVKEIKDNSVKTNESISALQENVSNLDSRLSDIEKLIHDAKKLMKWILGVMGAVFLSLVANFIYAYLH
ncbi:MAG: hypothetical protein QNJ60_19310 [Xenococcaceae cyanobacterium MO_188.B19]|nr:hypothetical protein [Xenococcaceae cyanobacterium MO_188.B19]